MQFLKSLRSSSAILSVLLCCSFSVWSPAANAGGLQDANALWLSGAFFEGTSTQPSPSPYFLSTEVIYLALVFDYFGDPAGQVYVSVKIKGETTSGAKYKDVFGRYVSVSEISNACTAVGYCMTWLSLGQLPEGYYEVKVSVKGVKPCKARGKAQMYIEVF